MSREVATINQNIIGINNFLPNLDALYEILSSGSYNFFLPARRSRCITSDYLLDLSSRKIYFKTKSEVKIHPNEAGLHIEKILLYTALKEILGKSTNLPLGFDEECLPDKHWLITVLYTLNPNHDLLRRFDQVVFREISKE